MKQSVTTPVLCLKKQKDVSSFSASSGIEQESLSTVSSSVGATRVRHTQMYLLFLLLQA
jgi:hypothetical protein